jgi:hypothetical protein
MELFKHAVGEDVQDCLGGENPEIGRSGATDENESQVGRGRKEDGGSEGSRGATDERGERSPVHHAEGAR